MDADAIILHLQEFEAHRESKDATIIDVRQPEELLTEGQVTLTYMYNKWCGVHNSQVQVFKHTV